MKCFLVLRQVSHRLLVPHHASRYYGTGESFVFRFRRAIRAPGIPPAPWTGIEGDGFNGSYRWFLSNIYIICVCVCVFFSNRLSSSILIGCCLRCSKHIWKTGWEPVPSISSQLAGPRCQSQLCPSQGSQGPRPRNAKILVLELDK